VRLAYARLEVPFESVTENVFEPSAALLEANALGQVPVLVSRFGALPDSSAILEYLHEEHGHRIWPEHRERRYAVRAAATLATGVMTFSVNHFLKYDPADALEVIERALKKLSELRSDLVDGGELTQAGWDLGVALSYLELRIPQYDWKKRHPEFEEILELCVRLAEWRNTSPPPA
jgi:glutathione S-transferase